MQTVTQPQTSMDDLYRGYLEEHSEANVKWLLEQTILTGYSRRAVVNMLPIAPGSRVLDLGTGFGALAFDIAAQTPAFITGVDVDDSVLTMARELQNRMLQNQCLHKDSSIEFQNADVYELPFEANTFDFVLARFLYQHLGNPAQATAEIQRVLKPNGYLCLMDVDDQFVVTHPEAEGALAALQDAVSQLQALRGGDRKVGRKLAAYMHDADLQVVETLIYPEAQFLAGTGNVGMEFTLRRFRELQPEIVEKGILSKQEFDAYIKNAAASAQIPTFHANGTVIALGRKRSVQ